mmetsp:Transcript_540/g.899  ORF Transcript_540/g.899 Transcript_540/m.899 type:complete len:381 (+) Transcript_540:44-1186(+)
MRNLQHLEGSVEHLVLPSFQNPSNRQSFGSVVLDQVILSILDTPLPLLLVRSLSGPHKHLLSLITNKHIIGIKLALVKFALSHQGKLKASSLFLQAEQFLDLVRLLGGLNIAPRLGVDGSFSAKSLPKDGPKVLVAISLFGNMDLGQSLSLIVDGTGELGSFHSLASRGLGSVHLVEMESLVQNKNVAGIQGRNLERHLGDTNIADLSLDVEQASAVLLGFDMSETTVDSSLPDLDRVFEIGQKEVGLVALNLTMLDWGSTQIIVEFHSLVSSGTGLVGGGLKTKPKVHIPAQHVLDRLGLEDNVRVTLIEVSILFLGPGNDLELLDPPNLKARGLASSLPLLLAGSRISTDVFLEISSQESDVGGQNIDSFLLPHASHD